MMLSKFNIYKFKKDNSLIIGNTFSTALIEINKSVFNDIKESLKKNFSKNNKHTDIIKTLMENKIITASTYEELNELRIIYEESCKGINAAGLAISLTLKCNFSCKYCYESRKNIDLSNKCIEQITNYVKTIIPNRKIFYVTWFGGEPLLKINLIEKLTNKFRAICHEYNCQYHATISTNGYLLNKININKLVSLDVKKIQLSIDGPQKTHDERRPLKNGKGSFNKIINNLREAINYYNNIYVRITLDDKNIKQIPQLFNILYDMKEKIILSFRPISPYSDLEIKGCSKIYSYKLSDEDKIINKAIKRGFRIIFNYSKPGMPFCAAYQNNSFIIDPFGDVHLCPVFIGNREKRYGIISESGIITNKNSHQKKFKLINPFDNKKCVSCKVFPLCMGGCLLHSDNNFEKCNIKRNILKRILLDNDMKTLTNILNKKE